MPPSDTFQTTATTTTTTSSSTMTTSANTKDSSMTTTTTTTTTTPDSNTIASSTSVLPIHCSFTSDQEEDVPEYAMIELNGALIPPVEVPTDTQHATSILGGTNRVELGRLQKLEGDPTPVMILGSHQLKGKVETLKEPFCVLQKQYHPTTGEVQAYQVVGVVKQKLMFNQYPKVIMR